MDKTLKRHLDAIRAGEVTKANVIGIRKAINHVNRLEAGLSGNRCNATWADVWLVEAEIAKDPPKVIGTLHDTGLQLLRSPRYAKRLAPYQDLIEWPKRFELLRFERLGDGLHVYPVYRLVGENGGTMTFRNIPWQSGGQGPEVLGTGIMAR